MTPPTERRARDPNDGGWHLDKKVPISLLFALLVQAGTTLWFISKLDSRVTLIETTRIDFRAAQHDRDERQDRDNAEAFSQVRQQLLNMDSKLDRLIERQTK